MTWPQHIPPAINVAEFLFSEKLIVGGINNKNAAGAKLGCIFIIQNNISKKIVREKFHMTKLFSP